MIFIDKSGVSNMQLLPKKSVVVVMLAFAAIPVFAQDTASEKDDTVTLEEVKVKASADANAKGLMKPYAGGQVAKGGRVGVMGNQDAMDTPFSINAYTNELIQNQQAKSVGDVLLNDPSVRVARGFGNFQESYFIRGFQLYSDSVAYNGLYGLLPRQYIAAELFERVEVLRGASAFLNGASPNGDGIGGSISLLPKRAPNEPLSVVNAGWSSGNQQLISADVARRFGPDDRAGIRLNVSKRDGGTAVNKEHADVDLVSLALDWRGEKLRLSGDIGYQDNHLKQTRTNVTLDAATGVPRAPKSDSNWAQPWSYSNERDTFGSLRGEYDLSEKITAYFAGGFRESHEANSLANMTVSNSATGAGSFFRFDNTREDSVRTGEVGLKGKFETGSISHDVVLNANLYHFEKKAAYAFGSSLATNLYSPTYYALPTAGFGAGVLSNPSTTGRTILRSVALGDTVSMLDSQLLVTLGLRHQEIVGTTYSYTGVFTDSYDKSKLSPVLGVVVKPWDGISLYANYIEGLSQGATAPGTSANPGQTLAPYETKQKEVGAKFDFGKVRVTTAYFTTDKPRGFVNAANVFTSQGKEEHQGLELMTYGQILPSLRVLGGITWLDTKQKNTENAASEGKQTIGIPDRQANFGVEWDAFMLPGLTFDARVITTGHFYANSSNTQRVPGWTRLDIGARYATDIKGHLFTVRSRIDNVTDRDYWASAGGSASDTGNYGYLVLGAPRTVTISAQLDF